MNDVEIYISIAAWSFIAGIWFHRGMTTNNWSFKP
jgi:hypothetical protein